MQRTAAGGQAHATTSSRGGPQEVTANGDSQPPRNALRRLSPPFSPRLCAHEHSHIRDADLSPPLPAPPPGARPDTPGPGPFLARKWLNGPFLWGVFGPKGFRV